LINIKTHGESYREIETDFVSKAQKQIVRQAGRQRERQTDR
jgi:hypothetical protein